MLTNFIPVEELSQRRENLVEFLQKDSAMILISSPERYKNSDCNYTYRQDSNFWYFTGYDFPESIYVLKKSEKGKIKDKLFVKFKTPEEEKWTGKGLSKAEIQALTGIENIGNIADFDIETYEQKKVYLDIDSTTNKHTISQWIELFGEKVEDANTSIKELRVIKSDWELEQIKKAVEISKLAHNKAQEFLDKNPNCWEYQIQAVIENEFMMHGVLSAYETIVASGNNANTIHYVRNNRQIANTDLVLIDAGCEYNYYSGDISRTISSNHNFSSPQKTIVDIVQKVHDNTILAINDKTSLQDLQKISTKMLVEELIKLGIVKESLEDDLVLQTYRQYWPHSVSHWLGLDTHDNGDYAGKGDSGAITKEHTVFTIEPGLYLPADDKNIPEEYRGIGVRIENDITVKGGKGFIL